MCIKIKISKSCWILIHRTFSTGAFFLEMLIVQCAFRWNGVWVPILTYSSFWNIMFLWSNRFDPKLALRSAETCMFFVLSANNFTSFVAWIQMVHWSSTFIFKLTEVNNLLFPLSLPPSTHSFSASGSCLILLDIGLQCVSVCMFLFSLPRPLGS